ncbi:hypothetical protein LA080_016029 [Diaporthe eres]|uniref:CCHC-type domain-containing protein n=1 Tax=Diaporthe vaccinii TaxID=105482 RepID=A0ABR4E020_9PEZI|nr:hypothetical protein LA080_016029 [Diaporthe eres]
MSGRFEGKCWECGGYGHTKADCPNLRRNTGSVDESVYRQPPAYGRRQREELFNERQEDPFAGFGGRFANQQQPQQQQQQYHGQMAPGFLGGMPVAAGGPVDIGVLRNADQRTAGEGLEVYKKSTGVTNASCVYVPEETGREIAAFLEARAAAKKRFQDPKSGRHVDIGTLPVLGRPGTSRPVRPQGQAGRGALPGARDEQPSRAGAGLLGHHRVEKPGASRSKGVRSVHTDHPPGFGCTICQGTDHTAAGCAKPTKAGDNTYCPYHMTVAGVEQHADSKCHTSVDRCFAEVVDSDGRPMARADVDRVVTDFVRANRGGRPEPRCERIHNHWAMCVARHIRANGLDGINACQLPVRRAEVDRRARSNELSWQQFSHRDLAVSCARFRDLHWLCDTQEQLVEKLEAYARVGLYRQRLQRLQGRQAREEGPAERPDVDMADVQGSADAGNASAASPAPVEESGSEEYLELDLYVRSDKGDDSDSEPEDKGTRSAGEWDKRKLGGGGVGDYFSDEE